MRNQVERLLAGEISTATRYFDQVVQLACRESVCDVLLKLIQCDSKVYVKTIEEIEPNSSQDVDCRAFLLNENLNYESDIELLLLNLKERMTRRCRVIAVLHNPYLKWFYQFANFLGLRNSEIPPSFITRVDLENVAALAGFKLERIRPVAHCPYNLFGLGKVINAVLPAIPFLRWFSIAAVAILRPKVSEDGLPSLSIVIPARNEKGNIDNALKRLPDFDGAELEVIFVEGHSSDDTWEEIKRVSSEYSEKFSIKSFQQEGSGKCDAVRLGFSKAKGELVTILDADLTIPPELLPRFYNAYRRGDADFINGNRLLYPMEGEAMRLLNRLGNVFFATLLRHILDVKIGDSLCGTKLLSRSDYQRMTAWRGDFGDFDPFGDFELLFPAAVLGLGIIDIPISYRARQYGSTQIHRFTHGWILLRMTMIGLLRIKFGRNPVCSDAS